MRPELPIDATFWRSGPPAPGDPAPGPGTMRPDALLVELGPAPEIAGGLRTDERLAVLYAAFSAQR
jgi:hypothetical protein